MRANHYSECPDCGDTINPGEDIQQSEDHGGWICNDCWAADLAHEHRWKKKEEQYPCPNCFTIHKGECL